MTDLVMKPEKAPVVQGRGLYRVYMNRQPLDLLFRAKNAGEADKMLQYLFMTQTKGKTLTVPDGLLYGKEEDNAEETNETDGQAPQPAEIDETGHQADADKRGT